MGNIASIDSKRPTMRGEAICTKCKHTWHAVVPENADKDTLDCPSCGSYHGAFRGPYLPEVAFVCNCGSKLFYLSPEGRVCHGCGVESFTWNEALEDEL